MLPVASVVTNKTFSEFELLKFSLEKFHECYWAISCDAYVYEKLKNTKNIDCLNIIASDDCDHNVGNSSQKDTWMKVMMTKFDAVEHLINKFGYGLFLDSDMVFVNPIEEQVLGFFNDKNVDACICQHMTNDWQNEAQHGLYNGGMFQIRNIDFLNEWRNLSKRYKELNLYFEQQPLEYIQRNFFCINLPINYNIGWWRFNRVNTNQRLNLLRVEENKIFFGKKSAINFHVHTKREIGYQNFGEFLVDKISSLLSESKDQAYIEILEKLKE